MPQHRFLIVYEGSNVGGREAILAALREKRATKIKEGLYFAESAEDVVTFAAFLHDNVGYRGKYLVLPIKKNFTYFGIAPGLANRLRRYKRSRD